MIVFFGFYGLAGRFFLLISPSPFMWPYLSRRLARLDSPRFFHMPGTCLGDLVYFPCCFSQQAKPAFFMAGSGEVQHSKEDRWHLKGLCGLGSRTCNFQHFTLIQPATKWSRFNLTNKGHPAQVISWEPAPNLKAYSSHLQWLFHTTSLSCLSKIQIMYFALQAKEYYLISIN